MEGHKSDRWNWPCWKLEAVARKKQMTDGWTMGGSKPAAPEFAQSDSFILRLSRLSRRAFAVFGVGAGLPNVNTLFLLHILASRSRNHADERTSMILQGPGAFFCCLLYRRRELFLYYCAVSDVCSFLLLLEPQSRLPAAVG